MLEEILTGQIIAGASSSETTTWKKQLAVFAVGNLVSEAVTETYHIPFENTKPDKVEGVWSVPGMLIGL